MIGSRFSRALAALTVPLLVLLLAACSGGPHQGSAAPNISSSTIDRLAARQEATPSPTPAPPVRTPTPRPAFTPGPTPAVPAQAAHATSNNLGAFGYWIGVVVLLGVFGLGIVVAVRA